MGRKRMSPTARRTSIAVAGAAALAFSFLAIPASAGLDSGGFAIKATNASEGISAVAGRSFGGNSGSNPGGNPGAETPAALATYSCGPMSFNLTQNMVDTSNIHSLDDSYAFAAGYIEGTPGVVIGASTALDIFGDDFTVMALDIPGALCRVVDRTIAPKANTQFGHENLTPLGGGTAESRYIQEGGELHAVRVLKSPDGTTVTRKTASHGVLASELYPDSYTVNVNSGFKEMRLSRSGDSGYDTVRIIDTATNGERSIAYMKTQGLELVNGQRADGGPTMLILNSSGKITSFTPSGGSSIAVPVDQQDRVADYYFERTGQRWDGRYPNMDSFDQSIPFEPSSL